MLLLLAGLLLSGCQAGAQPIPTETPASEPPSPTEATVAEPTDVPSAETVTIQVFYPVAVDAPIADLLKNFVTKFEAQNPNIKVEPVFSGGYGDVKTAIQTTIDGGGQPPAAAVMLAVDIYDLVNADYIIPLDDYINSWEYGETYINDFIPAFMENSYTEDGRLWSIPFQRSAVLLYYNADLFKEAGLEPPDSWESLAKAAQQLTVREGDKVVRWGLEWPSGWPYWLFQPLAIGNGQNIVGESSTEVYFDHPKVIEAVQYYIDLSHEYKAMPEGVQAVWGQAPSDFASGQTAMIVHSSGSLRGILDQADFEVGVMAIPGHEPGTYATVPGGGNLYIFKDVPKAQQDAAWKFIEFITRPENAAQFSIETGYIAPRELAYDTPPLQKHLEEVPQAAVARDVLKYAGKEFSVQNLGEVRNIFHDYLQKAYNGEMSPAEAMAAAQKAADEALAPFRE
jgi:sn-glycerol 3-phosphate transport system substrate-binding protein